MVHKINSRRKRSYKKRLILKYGHQCWICGVRRSWRTFTLDHIVPKCLGGFDKLSNFKLACAKCNSLRGAAMTRLLIPNYYKNRGGMYANQSS